MSKIKETIEQSILNRLAMEKRKKADPRKINYAESDEDRRKARGKKLLRTLGVIEEPPPRAEVVSGPGRAYNATPTGKDFEKPKEQQTSSIQQELEEQLAANLLQEVGTTKTRDGFRELMRLAREAEVVRSARIKEQQESSKNRREGITMLEELKDEPIRAETNLALGLISQMGVPGEEITITPDGVEIYRPQAQGTNPTYVTISFKDFVEKYRLDIDTPTWIETIGIIYKLTTGKIPNAWWGRVVVEQLQSGEQVSSVLTLLPHKVREELRNVIKTANYAGISLATLEGPIAPVKAFSIVEKAIQIEQEAEKDGDEAEAEKITANKD